MSRKARKAHIVGGRLGSGSEQGPYSISQMELKTAHELHKQVYVFVENPVYVEYGTYLRNENNPSFVPQYVNDVQIYKFLKEVYNYPVNNVISSFESVNDIIHFLREQWAGLFQRYLQDDSRREDYKISSNLKSTSEMLARIIEYTTKERDETIKSILVGAHPIFNQLAEAAQIHFRVFFTNKNELDKLLAAFEFEEVFPPEDESKLVYVRQLSNAFETLEIEKDIFDVSGNLTPLEHNKWNSKLVSITAEDCYQYDDDIPF